MFCLSNMCPKQGSLFFSLRTPLTSTCTWMFLVSYCPDFYHSYINYCGFFLQSCSFCHPTETAETTGDCRAYYEPCVPPSQNFHGHHFRLWTSLYITSVEGVLYLSFSLRQVSEKSNAVVTWDAALNMARNWLKTFQPLNFSASLFQHVLLKTLRESVEFVNERMTHLSEENKIKNQRNCWAKRSMRYN